MIIIRRWIPFITLVLFIVSLSLMRNSIPKTPEFDFGAGYFSGALCALLGYLAKITLDGNLSEIIGYDAPLRVINSLPFLVILPFALMIAYAETYGFTSPIFNMASVGSSVLFGFFFWPAVEQFDKANRR
ncbi:MAG: hypothetical protein QM500_10170 [Methylococcales bacterium]